MDNYKEEQGLLGVFLAIVWLGFAVLGFHVFYAVALTILLATLSGSLFVISAKAKESVKTNESVKTKES